MLKRFVYSVECLFVADLRHCQGDHSVLCYPIIFPNSLYLSYINKTIKFCITDECTHSYLSDQQDSSEHDNCPKLVCVQHIPTECT